MRHLPPIRELACGDPALPAELWQISRPPERLWIRGPCELFQRLPRDGLAIVGTRAPQPRACSALTEWVRALRGSSLIILSGFARGIDTQAHRAAIEARLPTIAVMATGLDHLYPTENEELGRAILDSGGVLVSEFQPGTPGRAGHFLLRNRLIAAWSQATWVVQAAARSGALNTARWAREHQRTCFAVPAFPGDPAMAGNQLLLDRDHALCFWGPHSLGAVWLELATLGLRTRDSGGKRPHGDPEQLALWISRICAETGGAPLSPLLEAALRAGWTPQRLFGTLQAGIQTGQLSDHAGFFSLARASP